MNQPLDEKSCHAIEDWGWAKNKNDMNIRLVSNIKNFEHIISFFCA